MKSSSSSLFFLSSPFLSFFSSPPPPLSSPPNAQNMLSLSTGSAGGTAGALLYRASSRPTVRRLELPGATYRLAVGRLDLLPNRWATAIIAAQRFGGCSINAERLGDWLQSPNH